MSLTFDDLRAKNVARCEDVFYPLNDWSPSDWATALAGECGETCNLIKKMRRGDKVPLADVAEEIADVIIQADLLAARLGIDLGQAIREKFNAVSRKRGSGITI